METDRLRALVRRTGALGLLDRAGLRGVVSEAVGLVGSPRYRRRWTAVRADFDACRESFRRVAAGAPAGDPARQAWMVCSMPTVWGLKLEGALSLAVRLADFEPLAVYVNDDRWSRRYHGLFDLRRSLAFPRLRAATAVEPLPEYREFVASGPRVSELLALMYRGVDVGRIVLSNVLDRRKFARFDLGDPATLAEVEGELSSVRVNVVAAEQAVRRARPQIVLVLEKGLSPMAEIAGVCLAEGIPVIQYTNSQHLNEYVLRRFHAGNRHQHPFSLDPASWEMVKAMEWKPDHEHRVMDDLNEGYRSGTWFSRKFLHHGKVIKPVEAVRRQLGLDPAKKTVVVFSHVLWDATFFYGVGIFDDYETWLVETVRAACRNPTVNWVIKLHPDLAWKLKYETYQGELRDVTALRSALGRLPDHVKLVMPDTDIDTYSFFELTDVGVTVRGTIGIEMACRGVPVLTAGTGRYAGLGFTIDSASKAEYLDRLASVAAVAPLAPGQVELARRFAYALFRLRPWPMRSFEMVKRPLEETGHPLDQNLLPRVSSFAELAAAGDMRQFAEWLLSDGIDFLKPVADGT